MSRQAVARDADHNADTHRGAACDGCAETYGAPSATAAAVAAAPRRLSTIV
jgi:hypothetical protein